MKLNNKVYDILKWVVMLALPAVATLWSALSAVWGWPLSEEVAATINAVTVFLGVVIGVSTANYSKTK